MEPETHRAPCRGQAPSSNNLRDGKGTLGKRRGLGLAIAVAGTLAVTPDAALLRLMELSGGTAAVITAWRFVIPCVFNVLLATIMQGGVGKLFAGVQSAVVPLLLAALISSVAKVGFVISLLKVDPAKALVLISLNPLWAALLGYVFLGDKLATKTVVALALSLVSILTVFVPNMFSLLAGTALPVSADAQFIDLVPLVTGVAVAVFLTYSRYCSMQGIADASMELAPPTASLFIAVVSIWYAQQQGGTSMVDGLTPTFWIALGVNGLCVAGYNAALVFAPRYLPSAEVALVLLGETIFGPIWVYFAFGSGAHGSPAPLLHAPAPLNATSRPRYDYFGVGTACHLRCPTTAPALVQFRRRGPLLAAPSC